MERDEINKREFIRRLLFKKAYGVEESITPHNLTAERIKEIKDQEFSEDGVSDDFDIKDLLPRREDLLKYQYPLNLGQDRIVDLIFQEHHISGTPNEDFEIKDLLPRTPWWSKVGINGRRVTHAVLAVMIAVSPLCGVTPGNGESSSQREERVETLTPIAKPFSPRDEILRVHRQGLYTPVPFGEQ